MIPLLIDANATCHKAKNTLGDLTDETRHVGVIFGFFLSMLKLAKERKTNQFAFAWDSKQSHRQKLFPSYKEKRRTLKEEKTQEEKEDDAAAYHQFDLLYEEILPAIGFQNNFKFKGFEGDDIIASLVENSVAEQSYIMVTGDEDMYQCLWPDVSMLKGDKLYTEKMFRKEYGISPGDWHKVKALAGCPGDSVPGIVGIGEKKACQYLRGEMTPNLKSYQAIRSAEGKKIYERNLPLVSLPFKGCPAVSFTTDKHLSIDAFMEVCQKYNFQYFLKKEVLKEWKTHLQFK